MVLMMSLEANKKISQTDLQSKITHMGDGLFLPQRNGRPASIGERFQAISLFMISKDGD